MFLSQTNGPLFAYNMTITETIKHLHDCGFRHFDVSFFSRFQKGSIYFSDDYMQVVEEYKEAIKKYNMVPVQSHEPAGNSIGDDGGEYYMKKTPRSIEMAAKIGCPSITIHPGTANTYVMTREEFVEKNIFAIKKLIPYAEEYGIMLLLENIGYNNRPQFAGVYTINAKDLITIVDAINHPLLKVNWDVGHANFNNLNQYKELTELGSRLCGLHLHDNMGFQDFINNDKKVVGDMHTFPLYYSTNYDDIIKALIEIGYTGTFNFEVDAPKGVVSYASSDPKLMKYARDVRMKVDTLLYSIGRLLLEKYNVFEE